MGTRRGNLRSTEPGALEQESVTALVEQSGVRIERIVSQGQTSPPGYWYDQEEDEFVLVVAGAAELEIRGEGRLRMGPGDWVDIPAHLQHRVVWTDPETRTVWLAVFRTPRE